jgi:hypothetical protein
LVENIGAGERIAAQALVTVSRTKKCVLPADSVYGAGTLEGAGAGHEVR